MSNSHENHQPHELTPAEQAAIEQSLAALVPAPPRVDRDRLMFLAGVASVTSDSRLSAPEPRTLNPDAPAPAEGSGFRVRGSILWPATSAALAATSLALAIALLARPTPTERIVYRDQPIVIAAETQSPAGHPLQPTPPLLETAANRTITPGVPAHNYLRTRDVALRYGLDALGTFRSAGGDDSPVPTYRTMLESLSPSRPRTAGDTPESSQM